MTRNEAARWLLERNDFLILTHRRPDGDTIGSAAALCHGLRSLGKTAHILENPEITPKYTHLHHGLTKKAWESGDTVISVDVAAPSLLTDAGRSLLERLQLRIDHHFSADSFAPFELVDHTAGACADIIYDLLVEQSIVPVPNQGYLVMVTDISSKEASLQELEEMRRETLQTAQQVIDKQMRVAQEIASLLGETTGETKAALLKLKASITKGGL